MNLSQKKRERGQRDMRKREIEKKNTVLICFICPASAAGG